MNVRKGCIMKFTKSAPLWGEITVPGDKSISHRAVMLGSLAEGTTEVTNFLKGADCISTIRAFQAMGIDIEEKEDTLLIHGKGLHGLQAPKETLDMGNSGTTTRLLSGILAGQTFETTLKMCIRDRYYGRDPQQSGLRPLRWPSVSDPAPV